MGVKRMRHAKVSFARKLELIVTGAVLLLSPLIASSAPVSAFSGGSGTSLDPYEITTCSELLDIASNLSASYVLANSITCLLTPFTPIGDSSTPFTGTFDGQGNTISDVTVSLPSNYVGIFGDTSGATISNLYLQDITMSGQGYVGGLVGYVGGGSVTNVFATSISVSGSGDSVGGLVGGLGGASMSKSSVEDVSVTGSGQYVGGLVGWVVGPSVLGEAYAQGTVTGDNQVGGVAGQLGAGPSIISHTYADVTFGSVGSDVIGAVAMGGMPSSNFMASAPFIETSTQSPLDEWDFDTIWYVRTGGYPGLRPTVTLSMLCNAPSVTSTSVSASCTTYPANLQTPLSWEIRYKPTLLTDYTARPAQYTDPFSDTISGLLPGTDYTVQFRHTSVLGTSEWGRITATTTGLSDLDGDGVSNLDESIAPNNGDANNDGTPDYTQANVTSVKNDTTSNYTVVQTTCTDNFNVMSGMEASGAQADSQFDYPSGLVGFVGRSCGVGATVTVNLYFYNEATTNLVLRKRINDVYMAVPATISQTTIAGKTVTKATYSVTDGGVLDDDGITDGNIVDPAGLAKSLIQAPNTGLHQVR